MASHSPPAQNTAPEESWVASLTLCQRSPHLYPQHVEQRDKDAGAACTQGVAQGDRPAVHIDPGEVVWEIRV